MLAHARANTNMLHVAALRRYRVNRLFGFSRRRLRVPGKLRATRYQWRSRRFKEAFVTRPRRPITRRGMDPRGRAVRPWVRQWFAPARLPPGHPRHFVRIPGTARNSRLAAFYGSLWDEVVQPPNDVVIITRDALLRTCSTLRHSTRKKGGCAKPATYASARKHRGNPGLSLALTIRHRILYFENIHAYKIRKSGTIYIARSCCT